LLTAAVMYGDGKGSEDVKNDNRGLLIAMVALVVLALIGPMIGGALFGSGGMWENTDQAAGWALGLLVGFGGLSALALPASLIVGMILLVRWLGARPPGRIERCRRRKGGWETRR
jgi:MFS family permease